MKVHVVPRQRFWESFRKTILVGPTLILAAALPLAAWEIPRGTVVDRVPCLKDAGQTYALYLPPSYSSERKWPIVYALDAGARGNLPVTRFRAAAEEFGYILVGSNNSRNGPIRAIETAVQAMLTDTQTRFSIAPGQVYFAGFSGGARVAIAVASTLPWRVAGVIACGAGFPTAIKPSSSTRFAFFGMAGLEDFNMPELRQLDERLGELGIPHRLDVFAGGHEWPPEALCSAAIEWMELQAMRSGARPESPQMLELLFSRMSERASSLGAERQYYQEFLALSALARDFDGLRDVAAVTRKRDELAESREYLESAARLSKIDSIQQRTEETFHRLVSGAVSGVENAPFAEQKLRKFVEEILKEARGGGKKENRVAASRMVSFCWVELNEAAAADFEAKDFRDAALRLRLLAEIRPDDERIHFHLARAYAMLGDKKKALRELGRAVDTGFADAGRLESSADFEALKDEKGFRDILGRIKN